jgi:PAS domain S-box-containing protein
MTKGEKTDERARTEEKYKALVETAADAIFTLDLLGRFTFANLTAERISGYSKEELVGRHFRELLPQEHIPVYLNMFQKALRGQPTPPIEIEMITKGGEKVPLELLGTPIKRGRRVVEIIGMARDITGRKRAEEAYRAVVDHSLQGLIIIQDFRMVFANQAFAEISGYTIEELLSLSPEKVQALVHPEDQALVWGRFQERLAGKPVPQRYEYRGFRKDGAVRWLEMFASPIEYHGKPAVQAAIIDITERKQAEEETQRNYDIQTTLNALLHTSLLDISLEDQLERVLNHILSIPWLALESRGGIFLVEDEPEVLVMKAQRGLATPLQTACARLPFGQCLCGRAALTREMQFADCINDRHETRYEGIAPHGHYCVPILFAGKVLGVINMYVKEGHRRDQREEEFLTAVANTLAGMIKRKRAEEALRAEKALMDALTDNIPDSIYFKDRQCRLTRINRMMMRSLGLKEMSQALGKTDIDLFGEEFGRETLAQDQYIMTTGEPIIGLIESRRLEDGQINWTSTTKVPLRDTSGQIVGLVGVTREINEVKQAEEEVQKRLREITALHRVSEVINATLDLKEVFQRVVEELSSTFGYRLVGLYLVEGEGLRLQAQVGYDSETAPDFIPLERGVVGRAARTGQPAFIRDVSQDPDYVASHPEITCEICIPVMSGGTILGALNVESDEKRPLIDDDLQLLSILSSHIGVAIENARLYEAQQQKSTQLTRILEVGNALRLNLELDQLLEKIAQAVRESMGFNLVVVHVLSEDGQSSVLRALAGYPPEARQKLLGANMPMSIVKPFVQERFKISRSYFVSHEHGLLDESVEEFTYIPGPGELSPGQWHPEDVLLVPLETKEGKSVGYLSADAPLDGKIPSLETIQILEIFANQAAIAIENARLFAERERRVKELSALHDVSLEVVAKTNLFVPS